MYSENQLFLHDIDLNSSDNSPWEKPLFSLSSIQSNLNHLAGKVLTLIDAAITEPTQRKALKDRIKQDFYDISDIFVATDAYKVLIDAHNEAKHYAGLMDKPVDKSS